MTILTFPSVEYAADGIDKDFLREYRLDLCEDWDYSTFDRFDHKCILTSRAQALDKNLLQRMASCGALVDLDLADYRRFPNLVPSKRLILSIHQDLLDKEAIGDFLELTERAFFYKIILREASFSDILWVRKRILASGKKRVIFNVMGRWAIFQRALHESFASCGYYAAIGPKVVKEQPDHAAITDIRRNLARKDALVYGILGGKQVNESLSLSKYNDLFWQKQIAAAFLPFPTNDLDEFLVLISFLKQQFRLAGLAVTSPHKQALAQYLNCEMDSINTVQFRDNHHSRNRYNNRLGTYVYEENTDLVAFRQSLDLLGIEHNDRILIYGTGDCGDAFAGDLITQGYRKPSIMGRNPAKVSKLNQRYALTPLEEGPYDLFINASFLGLDPLDKIEHLPGFLKILDLPYHRHSGPTGIIKHAISESIPYIDGHEFWRLQYEAQKDCLFFSDELSQSSMKKNI